VDIVEGVNDETPNACSLHTGPSKIASESVKTTNTELGFQIARCPPLVQ
jgi:hypothetical protein